MALKIDMLTEFLRKKTNYDIAINVINNKILGYIYSIKISADDFNTYATVTTDSTNKEKIYQEIKQSIPKFNFLNERRISVSKNQKNVKHSALYCCICEKEKGAAHFHRNTNSPMFAGRGGYCNICFDCAKIRALQILKDSNAVTAIMYLCALYDRPIIKKLIHDVLKKDLSSSKFDVFSEYFRRVSLIFGGKKENITFAKTEDISDNF
jgi:hypothetical protein